MPCYRYFQVLTNLISGIISEDNLTFSNDNIILNTILDFVTMKKMSFLNFTVVAGIILSSMKVSMDIYREDLYNTLSNISM